MEKLRSADKLKLFSAILLCGIMALVSCSKKTTETPAPAPTPSPVVNNPKDSLTHYIASVKPLTDKYCISCHFEHAYVRDLSSFLAIKDASDSGVLSERLFVKKDMPPSTSPQPTKTELETIKKWINDGCKE